MEKLNKHGYEYWQDETGQWYVQTGILTWKVATEQDAIEFYLI